jgi:hypothetical protein
MKSSGMLHDTFIAVLTLLHVNNNGNSVHWSQLRYDQCKMFPIVIKLTKKFQEVYTSEKILMVDMIQFVHLVGHAYQCKHMKKTIRRA